MTGKHKWWVVVALGCMLQVVRGTASAGSTGSTSAASRALILADNPLEQEPEQEPLVAAAELSRAPWNPMLDDDGVFDVEVTTPAETTHQPTQQQLAAPELLARTVTAIPRLAEASAVPPMLPMPAVMLPPVSVLPPPLPSSVSADLERHLRAFKFKGFGLSFIKSLTKWDQCGLGLRIPITANFPEYDRNSALPRLTTMLGLFYELQSGFFFRGTFSLSFPVRMAALLLAYLGAWTGVSPGAWVDRIRRLKARDSIRRLGLTFTMRICSSGCRFSAGPWLFYVPGVRLMSHILPFIFSTPALILTLVNCLVAMNADWLQNETDRLEAQLSEMATEAAERAEREALAYSTGTITASTSATSTSTSAPVQAAGNEKRRLHGLYYWHSALLKWCESKTTGLGWNVGMTKSGPTDTSLGTSVLFEIQPFFPRLPAIVVDSLTHAPGYINRAVNGFGFAPRGRAFGKSRQRRGSPSGSVSDTFTAPPRRVRKAVGASQQESSPETLEPLPVPRRDKAKRKRAGKKV